MGQKLGYQELRIASFAYPMCDYHCIVSFRDLPTIRLLDLVVSWGVYGIDTLFPTTGTVKWLKRALFVPTTGTVDCCSVPTTGLRFLFLRWFPSFGLR